MQVVAQRRRESHTGMAERGPVVMGEIAMLLASVCLCALISRRHIEA